MQKRHLCIIFSVLALFNAVSLSGTAMANGSWQPLEIIDMTTTDNATADVVVTTGFFDDLDFTSLNETVLSVASGGIRFDTASQNKSGWAGLVEVEMSERTFLPFEEASTFADTLASSDDCLLYTSPSPRDKRQSRMPSSA